MNILEMTKEDFEKIPHRKSFDETIYCTSLVLLPVKEIHSSGWRCFDVIAIDNNDEPICACSGCSDILHIDGISIFDANREGCELNNKWSIDCLTKSGLFRLFPDFNPNEKWIKIGSALSDLCIYGIKGKDNE